MCVNLCVSMYIMCMQYPQMPEGGVVFPGARFTGICEPSGMDSGTEPESSRRVVSALN